MENPSKITIFVWQYSDICRNLIEKNKSGMREPKLKEHAVIKDSINALMLNANTLLIDTTTAEHDKYILFDDLGRGTIIEKPSTLEHYNASDISSVIYQYLAQPTFGSFKRDDCVNRGLLKLDSGEVVTIEVVPINTGFHLWVRKSIDTKPAINVGRADWGDNDIVALGAKHG